MGFNEGAFSTGVANPDPDAQGSGKFGAKQVIIVRETVNKVQLKGSIGEFALILTIMESKGMEFEDVLLYDFFSTSECMSAFRALGNSQALNEKHIVCFKCVTKGMTTLIYSWGKGIMFGAKGNY